MGLLNLFSKNGRDSIKAKFEYDDCSKTRQARFHSYRKNAIQDILFKYPDAQLLLNRLDQRFMIFLGSQGILQVGKFADDYYPKLDYIDDLATIEERQTAVTQFRYQANRCVGSISEEAMPRFKNACRWLSKNVTETFQKKGYAITGKIGLKYLIGGALFLNERQIAKATIWNTKTKGYFNTRLFEEVVQETNHRPGTQVLTFVTVDSNPIGEGQKMSYEIIFDRSIHRFDANNPNEFTKSILNLRDFMYALEDYFHPNCLGSDEDKLEYTFPDSEESLDSAARDEDEPVESRYLL